MSKTSFAVKTKDAIIVDPSDNVFNGIWDQYERVVVESLFTSFGLDFIVRDQTGGDVDTIYNVRNLKDENGNVIYKNSNNASDYNNRPSYDGEAYHKDSRYTSLVHEAKKRFDSTGEMIEDAYVEGNKLIPKQNKSIPRGKQGQNDHVVSAEEIHNDPGRVLAEMDGMELANCPENLRYTNAALNNNMRAKSAEEYIKWAEEHPDQVNYNGNPGEPLPESVKQRLRDEYNRAHKAYDEKLNRSYYTSSKFVKDTLSAAGSRGIEMGTRQVVGFILLEVWIQTKDCIQALPSGRDVKTYFAAIGNGIKKGFENAQKKYKDLIRKFGEGFLAGAISSLTTTICNIFFTTAKNLVKCLRQIYASVVQAANVLFFNPDKLLLGDRIKKTAIILSTGASVLVGTAVGELIEKTFVGAIPTLGNIIKTFCSTLVSGLLSCTFLIILDRSKFVNRIINRMNRINLTEKSYLELADLFTKLAAEYAKIDLDSFIHDVDRYGKISTKIMSSKSERGLNRILLNAYKDFNIRIPWDGDFDEFMSNKSNQLQFS